MPALYFASDLHLRPDIPERGQRLARLVERLQPGEELILVGDVCDFWFASRRRVGEEQACPGMMALADLRRRGGLLTIMLGNHDRWLGKFYQSTLGARVISTPAYEIEAFGLRVHMAHGHLLGGRKLWKIALEGQAFLAGFRLLPRPVAQSLQAMLDYSNEVRIDEVDRRHLAAFQRYAESIRDRADLVVLGHVHRAIDDTLRRPRLVVLGDWKQQTSYLKLDAEGARLHVIPDPD